jgi:protein-S-isoprenylcysteine O-methyltransferase Ste14
MRWLILQFLTIGIILWPIGWRTPSWWAGILMIGGLGLTLWALAHNQAGNFRLSPTPQAGGVLITGGPYRFMRHPMYSALLLMMAGACASRESLLAVLAWGVLALVLDRKARLEERLLAEVFPEYVDYCEQVRRW